MKFFLSYASDHDRPEAEAIKNELEELNAANPHQVFVDYEHLHKAQDTDERINDLLEQVDAVLYLITVSSARSFWCGKEIGYAQCLGKPIVPIAGPGITAEFIKANSVPWISGLKWVNWWEKNRGQKIVEAMDAERGVVELVTKKELQQDSPWADLDDCILYGLKNQRDFGVTDLTVRIELYLGKSNRASSYVQTRESRLVCLKGRASVFSPAMLDTFRDGKVRGSEELFIEETRTGRFELEHCRALFILKYCIGGQRYLTRFFDVPLLDVCPTTFMNALLAAAQKVDTRA
jgi:hypothetical protein